MNATTESVVTIGVAIIGVAILAVLVSKKSNTPSVLQAAGSAFSNALGVAVSPVSGANLHLNTAYPTSADYGSLNMPTLGN